MFHKSPSFFLHFFDIKNAWYNTKDKLKEYYNSKVTYLKEELFNLSSTIDNKAIQIKVNEVTNILNPLSKTSNVGDDNLINLLQYCALLEELKVSNGWRKKNT